MSNHSQPRNEAAAMPGPGGGRRGRTQLIVMVSVFVVLAVAVAWVWWRHAPAQPNVEQGRAAAERFLEQLRAGQAASAWESTTTEFKSAQGRQSFIEYVKKNPRLGQPASFVAVQQVTLNGSPRAEYVYRQANSKGTLKLLAGAENGTWRIDRIRIE